MIIQSSAFALPHPDNTFHCIVTSPPYWGLRRYEGEQGENPLGAEATPEKYIERIVEAFREIYRVLRPDGVAWLNIADSYSAGGWESSRRNIIGEGSFDPEERRSGRDPGVPAGNLILIPQRLIIALQREGWIIRANNIWYKRNPMPESVSGWRFENGKLRKGSWRHTRDHEVVFMLSKNMKYWSNKEAVKEIGTSGPSDIRKMEEKKDRIGGKTLEADDPAYKANRRVNIGKKRSVGSVMRNPRSVFDVPTVSYSGQHFATFPPNLIAPLIRATCPRRACLECGTGWSPVIERSEYKKHNTESYDLENFREGDHRSKHAPPIESRVIGYRPSCECGREDFVPGIVLDPFGGSGTTGMVAKELMRKYVVADISLLYLDEQAKVRTRSGTPSGALENLPLFAKDESGDG